MIADLFEWEMERLSLYLKKNYPEKRFCILMDKCSSHKRIVFESLELIYFPPCTSGILQPLDLQVKSKYRKWLAQQKLTGLFTTERQAVQQVNSIYLNLSQKCVNGGKVVFKVPSSLIRERNSRNSRFLGNRMYENSSKFLKIPDF